MLHLADRQTACSCKLEAVIGQLGGSVCEALSGRGLGEEIAINLRPEPKETSVDAARGQRHSIEGREIDTRDVVGLEEEKEWLDAKKRKGQKLREE